MINKIINSVVCELCEIKTFCKSRNHNSEECQLLWGKYLKKNDNENFARLFALSSNCGKCQFSNQCNNKAKEYKTNKNFIGYCYINFLNILNRGKNEHRI